MAVKHYYKIQVIVEVCCTEHCKDLYKTIASIWKWFSIYSLLTVFKSCSRSNTFHCDYGHNCWSYRTVKMNLFHVNGTLSEATCRHMKSRVKNVQSPVNVYIQHRWREERLAALMAIQYILKLTWKENTLIFVYYNN